MNKLAEKINIILFCLGTVTLIGLQIKFLGWFLLLLGFITLLFCRRQFAKDVLLIYISIGILRRYLNFHFANLVQAVLFTSFLYELGFTGWGPLIIYPFALSQGYIFKKTESLFYIITIHLALDLILFLALINAHHPNWIPIFVLG